MLIQVLARRSTETRRVSRGLNEGWGLFYEGRSRPCYVPLGSRMDPEGHRQCHAA